MALMRLQLGGEVDLATGDELRDGLDALGDKLLGRPEPNPTYLALPQSILGIGNIAIMDHGSPPIGRIWELKFWVPLGGSPISAVPPMSLFLGPSSLLVDTLTSQSEAVPMHFCRIPNRITYTFFGTDALWCHSNENIVVATSANLTVGTIATSVIQVAEWRERDVTMHIPSRP